MTIANMLVADYFDEFGPPKSKASKAPVPMHPLLAAHLLAWRKETLYPGDEDFVFPSLRLKGKKPPREQRRGRPESSRHRVPSVFTPSEERWPSVLVKMKVDVKTVQEILRRQNLKTILEIYAKSMSEDRLLAQGMFLELLFCYKKPELLDGVVLQQ